MRVRFAMLLAAACCAVAPRSRAVELKVSSGAIERTLVTQLFAKDAGRFYLRGNAHSGCYVYAESPQVKFAGDRVVVHLHVRARLGTSIRGACLGIGLARDVDVSVAPDAEGETIGFRDARIDKLSGSKELDVLLMPFLIRKIPSSMKVNAATQLRRLLTKSAETTGYEIELDRLLVHSMSVQNGALLIDLDGEFGVN
ncbi:MAG: hypothetical protein WAM66_02320 [Acidobacteriaceae bacterium]